MKGMYKQWWIYNIYKMDHSVSVQILFPSSRNWFIKLLFWLNFIHQIHKSLKEEFNNQLHVSSHRIEYTFEKHSEARETYDSKTFRRLLCLLFYLVLCDDIHLVTLLDNSRIVLIQGIILASGSFFIFVLPRD